MTSRFSENRKFATKSQRLFTFPADCLDVWKKQGGEQRFLKSTGVSFVLVVVDFCFAFQSKDLQWLN